MNIEIVNFREVNQFIDDESANTIKLGMDIVKKTGIRVMHSMKKFITPAVITGRLRASVHVEAYNNTGGTYKDQDGKSFNGAFSVNAKENEVFVGTNVEYAEKANKRSRAAGYFERGILEGEKYMAQKLREAASK